MNESAVTSNSDLVFPEYYFMGRSMESLLRFGKSFFFDLFFAQYAGMV